MGMTVTETLEAIKNILTGGETKQADTVPREQVPTPHKQTAQNAEDVRAAAVTQERARMAALDAMKTGSPAVDSIIEAAKANGASAESVKPYVDAVASAPTAPADTQNKEKMLDAIRAILHDSKDSNAGDVHPTPQPMNGGDAAEKERNINDIANYANRLRGVE